MKDIVKEHMLSIFEKGARADGRKFDEYRKPITVESSISPKNAEGSARVRIGQTEVLAGVKMDVGAPFPDTPGEGVLIVNTELLPLSSPEFESGPPSIQAIELSRIVDRGIRESKAIDLKALCVKKGEKVWMVFVDIYPINDAGNLVDAAALAALAALRDAHFPKFDGEKIDYTKQTKKGLPLADLPKLPVSCTVRKIGNKFIIDPTDEEEEIVDARLTVASLENGDICAMQKGEDASLTIEEINEMVDIALAKSKELRKILKG